MVVRMLPLTSVASVYTEKQFAKLLAEKPELHNMSYIKVIKELKRGKRCAYEVNEYFPSDSVAILPNSQVVKNGYLLFLLNSYPTQYELFEHKMNVLTHVAVNKKRLSLLEIPIIDIDEQWYYDLARKLLDNAEELTKDSTKDQHMAELTYGMFNNLCDSLAIELYFNDFLEEEGVYIFKYWKENVDKYFHDKSLDTFFFTLVDQSSELRNQLMKLRMIPTDHIKE